MTAPSQGQVEPPDGQTESRLLWEAQATEVPAASVCIDLANHYFQIEDDDQATMWCLRVTDAGNDYRSWYAAAQLLKSIRRRHQPTAARSAKVAVLGSYTTNQLVGLLHLIGLRRGVSLDIYEAGFNQYQQEILDPESGLYRFGPDVVVLAVDERQVGLPSWSDDPGGAVVSEVERWATLWSEVARRTGAAVVQTNFVVPSQDPYGHLSTRLEGSRTAMLRDLNARIGQAAGETVAILDTDRLASMAGKSRWSDARYWFLAKQAVGLEALPTLSLHLMALIGAQLGLARKCLVVDLDGTLWGGVIGEDGVEGIALGHGADGEAFAAFQEYLLALKQRGVILAVCSKNDEKTAREPFESHPDMRVKTSDFAVFVANWQPKPANVEYIAQLLNISTDALAFVDDQPVEREAVRTALPEVDVIVLPESPSDYTSALASYPFFEVAALTKDDRGRNDQYRARAMVKEAEIKAESLDDFLDSLDMRAEIRDFDSMHLARVAQLIGKTNQFNLTGHRHSQHGIEAMMSDRDYVTFHAKLKDRFGDNGLVGVAIARQIDEATMEIDTFLLSCRVIGRTLENTMLDFLYRQALTRGCRRVVGVYRSSGRNGIVADLYERNGFTRVAAADDDDETKWELDLGEIPPANPFIRSI